MALPSRARLSFPPKPVSPFRKIEQCSYPHSSENRQKKQELQPHRLQENHNHRKLTKMITWIRACVTQKCHEPCHAGPPKMERSWWRVLTKYGPLRREWQTTLVFLPQEIPQYEKAKKNTLEDEPPQVSRCPICYWGRAGK